LPKNGKYQGSYSDRKIYIFSFLFILEEVRMVPHKKREEYRLEKEIEKEVEAVLKGEDDLELPSPAE